MCACSDGLNGLESALLLKGITRAYPGGVIACRGGHPLMEPPSAYLPPKLPAKKKNKKKKKMERGGEKTSNIVVMKQ